MPYISPEDADVMIKEFEKQKESYMAENDRLGKMAEVLLTGDELDRYIAALGDARTKCVKYYTALSDVLRHGSPWIPFRKMKPKPFERCLFLTRSLMFEGTMTESGTVSRNGSDDYESVLGEQIVSWIPIPDIS